MRLSICLASRLNVLSALRLDKLRSLDKQGMLARAATEPVEDLPSPAGDSRCCECSFQKVVAYHSRCWSPFFSSGRQRSPEPGALAATMLLDDHLFDDDDDEFDSPLRPLGERNRLPLLLILTHPAESLCGRLQVS